MSSVWAVGLMTGTVIDGQIDVAMLRTNGEHIDEFGPWALMPYTDTTRSLLFKALDAARVWNFSGPEPEFFKDLERVVTLEQTEAVAAFLKDCGMAASEIAVVGFHGQSVLHRPPTIARKGTTRQLGDGQLMADRLGIATAYDFRSEDMRQGGQGAPLAPVYHAALLQRANADANSAVLNLGGVANITWRATDGTLAAFDTGPANAPINDWIAEHGGGEMDFDGALARKGKVDEARLEELLRHAYFDQHYPKSLDRNDFTSAMATGLSLEDGAATLTAFSASAVGKALDVLPLRPSRLIVCGGGRRNPALMHEIEKRTGVQVITAEAVGWRGDTVEAECFAFLAVRVMRGLPISFPLTTGVPAPMAGGQLARPRR